MPAPQLAVACPFCGAQVGEECSSSNRWGTRSRRRPHPDRRNAWAEAPEPAKPERTR